MSLAREVSMSQQEFKLLSEFLRASSGLHFAEERLSTLARRLAPRLAATGSGTYLDYYHALKYGPPSELLRAMELATNNETYFFRESAQLRALVSLAKAAPAGRPFRVLSAGCSSGEEPYSVAILVDRAGQLKASGVEILGIDISERQLEKARRARYSANSFRGTEGAYLDWYFSTDAGALVLDERLRSRVKFAHANLLDVADGGRLGKFDAILCRNVIIYFDSPTKAKVIQGFSDMLVDGGHLFLGHSESLYNVSSDFDLVHVDEAAGYRKSVAVRQAAAS